MHAACTRKRMRSRGAEQTKLGAAFRLPNVWVRQLVLPRLRILAQPV